MAWPIARVNVGIIRNWGGTATNTLTTAAASLTAGNTLIVSIGAQDVAANSSLVTGVTDTAGNTYTKVDNAYTADWNNEIWYAKNVTGHASNQVTITFAGNVQYRGASATKYFSLHATAPLDTIAKATQPGGGSGITIGTLTTTAANEVHILVTRFGVTPTYPAGFTDVTGDQPYLQVVDKITTATMSGTYSTSGSSNQTVILVGAFKAASGTPPLTRVRATPKVNGFTASLTLAFPTPPTVGNGIVVIANCWNTTPTACTDNQGNSYNLAISRNNGAGTAIFWCEGIQTTGSPFSISVSAGGSTTWWAALAIEVTGIALGLGLDQGASATGSST